MNEPIIKKKKGFLISAKKVFLTYPATDISREDVLKQLHVIFRKMKNKITEYLICQENHLIKGEDEKYDLKKIKKLMKHFVFTFTFT